MQKQNLKTIVATTLITSAVMLSGCANNMNKTQENTLGGAAVGAAAGAVIGGIVGGKGSVLTGALIGTGAGAVGGSMMTDGSK